MPNHIIDLGYVVEEIKEVYYSSCEIRNKIKTLM